LFSCEGFEEQFLALLTTIEAVSPQKEPGSCSNVGNKGIRELKRLECSINYDSKFENSSHAYGNVRGSSFFNEA
jgi:hypothetical protein